MHIAYTESIARQSTLLHPSASRLGNAVFGEYALQDFSIRLPTADPALIIAYTLTPITPVKNLARLKVTPDP